MSLERRWLDPMRSRWYLRHAATAHALKTGDTLTAYLRLDDVYSYLLVQILPQLNDILAQALPLKVLLSTALAPNPSGLTASDWQAYSLADAHVLAEQHRFIFQANCKPPDTALQQQALEILANTPLTGEHYLKLLQNIFHIIWQQQTGKLTTLLSMSRRRCAGLPVQAQQLSSVEHLTHRPVSTAFLTFAGRDYRAIDDLLRLTRKLRYLKLLTEEPVFLINHIEWREHLVSDPQILADIQALPKKLTLYIALEDPISWLLLAYLARDMQDYYNVPLEVCPLPYQGRDDFNWNLMQRLAKRVGVAFGPFCRPDAASVSTMAQVLYATPPQERLAVTLKMLAGAWTKGLDLSYPAHLNRSLTQGQQWIAPYLGTGSTLDIPRFMPSTEAQNWLKQHQQQVQHGFNGLKFPDLPIMSLHIGTKTQVFCSLYRVWQVETTLVNALVTHVEPPATLAGSVL